MTEYELNKRHAEKLAQMIMQNPMTRVVVKIDTDGIDDNYAWMVGYMYAPTLEKIVLGEDDAYHIKSDDYDDCMNYYGNDVEDWTDEEVEQKAKEIPWETVIAVNVSAT